MFSKSKPQPRPSETEAMRSAPNDPKRTETGGAAKTSSPPPQPARSYPPSIISGDMKIIGNIECEGDIQIDGKVEGDIRTKKVTVGEKATVDGAISGDHVIVSGTVNGQISGNRIELTASAKVIGDIHHDSLAIEAGAFLQGLCRRIVSAEKAG